MTLTCTKNIYQKTLSQLYCTVGPEKFEILFTPYLD
jgi:hypothetical protein